MAVKQLAFFSGFFFTLLSVAKAQLPTFDQRYIAIDTAAIACSYRWIEFKADGSFRYTSECLVAYGTWKQQDSLLILSSYKNTYRACGSSAQYGKYKITYPGFIEIQVLDRFGQPLVCEAIEVGYPHNKNYRFDTLYTDYKGRILVNDRVDSIGFVDMYRYYQPRTQQSDSLMARCAIPFVKRGRIGTIVFATRLNPNYLSTAIFNELHVFVSANKEQIRFKPDERNLVFSNHAGKKQLYRSIPR